MCKILNLQCKLNKKIKNNKNKTIGENKRYGKYYAKIKMIIRK